MSRFLKIPLLILWALGALFYFTVGGALPGFAYLAGSAAVRLFSYVR